jgi:hypothetical protein
VTYLDIAGRGNQNWTYPCNLSCTSDRTTQIEVGLIGITGSVPVIRMQNYVYIAMPYQIGYIIQRWSKDVRLAYFRGSNILGSKRLKSAFGTRAVGPPSGPHYLTIVCVYLATPIALTIREPPWQLANPTINMHISVNACRYQS